jgi:hypothetical protein
MRRVIRAWQKLVSHTKRYAGTRSGLFSPARRRFLRKAGQWVLVASTIAANFKTLWPTTSVPLPVPPVPPLRVNVHDEQAVTENLTIAPRTAHLQLGGGTYRLGS